MNYNFFNLVTELKQLEIYFNLEQKSIQREQWNNKLGFILAAVGSAVGLGNLWGFAYRSSQGGGAAFVLLYILVVLVVCLPIFVAEFALGRNTSTSAFLAPIKAAGPRWAPLGWLFLIAPLAIASYYAVIMGWTADIFIQSLFVGLPLNPEESSSLFNSIHSGKRDLIGQIFSLILGAYIISGGIKKGIEKTEVESEDSESSEYNDFLKEKEEKQKNAKQHKNNAQKKNIPCCQFGTNRSE